LNRLNLRVDNIGIARRDRDIDASCYCSRLKLGAIHYDPPAAGIATTNDFAFFLNRDRSANWAKCFSCSVERSREAVGNFALPIGASFGIQWRECEK
jgi:hypothetical protein